MEIKIDDLLNNLIQIIRSNQSVDSINWEKYCNIPLSDEKYLEALNELGLSIPLIFQNNKSTFYYVFKEFVNHLSKTNDQLAINQLINLDSDINADTKKWLNNLSPKLERNGYKINTSSFWKDDFKVNVLLQSQIPKGYLYLKS